MIAASPLRSRQFTILLTFVKAFVLWERRWSAGSVLVHFKNRISEKSKSQGGSWTMVVVCGLWYQTQATLFVERPNLSKTFSVSNKNSSWRTKILFFCLETPSQLWMDNRKQWDSFTGEVLNHFATKIQFWKLTNVVVFGDWLNLLLKFLSR